ncbi:MAG: efflux RND transporter periplasmic adaptor subunit [Bryobacteraceae bacterium]
MIRPSFLVLLIAASTLSAQNVELVAVEARPLGRIAVITGELLPWQQVDLRARVAGFVETIRVDRGDAVREGDVLAVLSAPELESQIAEAAAKVRSSEAAAAAAKASLVSARATLERLEQAAKTEGAVAGLELVHARQAAEAAENSMRAAEAAAAAAREARAALEAAAAYLQIRAPFSGVVTERFVHPGALAGPSAGPLFRLEQTQRLRLVAAVPEQHYATVRTGAVVSFTVAAHPGQSFRGTVARFARALDPRTRTMAVELDVPNPGGALAPGLFAEVQWPVQSAGRVFVVPASGVVRTTERIFVIRVRDGRAEWVNVRPGARQEGRWEVYGPLREGDLVVKNATDEIRDGATLSAPRP